MTRGASHYETPTRLELSGRQRQVLELIARGKTNPEIAQQLGISLDGAKWHVSEILGKLAVSTREEAAARWRAERSPRRRLGTLFRAVTSFGGWKLAAGGTAVLVAMAAAVAVLLARDGNEHDAAITLPDCDADQVFLTAREARDQDGFFQLAALMAGSAEPCRLRATVTAGVRSPQSLPQGFRLPGVDPGGVDLDTTLGPGSTSLVYATWASWCESIPTTELVFSLLDKQIPLFLVNSPRCVGAPGQSIGNSPIVLRDARLSSLLPDLGPQETVYCYADPKWQTQCEQVDRFQQALLGLNGGPLLVDNLVRLAAPRDYTCRSGGFEGAPTLCRGVPNGEVRQGIPVVFHGSEGDVLSVVQLGERLSTWLNAGVRRVATIGCPKDGDCSQRFLIGISVDAQPSAVYLQFEMRPEGIAMTAAGVAGDVALEIRRGGSLTHAGVPDDEFQFVPVVPPY
jgi:DNA-binding CsgD family transcriptional regulator